MSSVMTGVTPVPAASPLGVEIAVPFQIDPSTGGVAVQDDQLLIVQQHLVSLINTMLTERLMIPGYGGNAPAHVFDVNSHGQMAFLQKDIAKAITAFEPAAQNVNVAVSASTAQPSMVIVSITYSYAPYGAVQQITVGLGGSVQEVISP